MFGFALCTNARERGEAMRGVVGASVSVFAAAIPDDFSDVDESTSMKFSRFGEFEIEVKVGAASGRAVYAM